jgi:hypothetical protein
MSDDPADSGYGKRTTGAPTYGAPTYGAPTYGAPTYGAPTYGAPTYGAPTYGAPTTGPPEVRKKRKWPRILLGVSLALIILIGGCTAFVVKSTQNIVGVGNKFLSALQTSADSARSVACDNAPREEIAILRSKLTAAGWKGEKRLTSISTSSASGVEPTGSLGGVVKVDAGYRPIQLVLRKESDWCVYGATVDFDKAVSETDAPQQAP